MPPTPDEPPDGWVPIVGEKVVHKSNPDFVMVVIARNGPDWVLCRWLDDDGESKRKSWLVSELEPAPGPVEAPVRNPTGFTSQQGRTS